jgi:hypothetical protein
VNLRPPAPARRTRPSVRRRSGGRAWWPPEAPRLLLGLAAVAVLATILTLVLRRDKATALARPAWPTGDTLNLARPHDLLFQVVGTRAAPRMLPVAAIVEGALRPIVLDEGGWRALDATYFRRGAIYPIYQDGSARGQVRVVRGMWDDEEAAEAETEGCDHPLPLAHVRLDVRRPPGFAVELFASTTTLGSHRAAQPIHMPRLLPVAQDLAAQAARLADVSRRALDSLDFRVVAVATGATPAPTLVSSWLDSTASTAESPSATTRHLFLIADQDSSGAYVASYLHRVNGPLGTAEFRRYIDHLDVTGDGVDELLLEGWHFRGDTWLSILSFDRGLWKEIYRAPMRWCRDGD